MNIEAIASNVRGGANPSYTVDDFLVFYPQFASVKKDVLAEYIAMANESVLYSRWHSKWKTAIGLYVAHFVTLWAKTASTTPLSPSELARVGESKGAQMSKSVDGVSISYGETGASSDLQGYGSFKDTLYGQQFATLSKWVGFGGMYVR